MKYFIFVILLSVLFILYVYYEKKLVTMKKQLMITSKQYNKIRQDYKSNLSKNQNLNVQFITPNSKGAITNIKTDMFLAPLYDSPKLKTLTTKMEVKILDAAIVNNDTWYYVSLPIDTAFNSRGWINKKEFSLIYSNTNDIITKYK